MSDDPFQHFDSKTLHDDVADVIRQVILRGDIAPGEKINQAQIALKLGTSRGPVREGLKRLREEGLVREVPYKGTFVIEITPTYIEELYGIRRTLEGYAIRCAIERAGPEDLEKLQAVVEQMQQITSPTDLDHSVELDLSFHYLICKAAHHELLLHLWKSIEAGVRLCLAHRHRTYRDLHKHLDTHRKILAAIEAKDAEEAAHLLDFHIEDAGEAMYRSWVASMSPEPDGRNN